MEKLPALAKRLCYPLVSVTLSLLASLYRHIESAQMVLELQINCSLRRRKVNRYYFFRPRDLMDLCNILKKSRQRVELEERKTANLSDKKIQEGLPQCMTVGVPL
jgi:hypothetical protein